MVAAALTFAAVGTANASSHAWVRVLHASPDAPAVDVYLDDTIVSALTNVPFATISDYLEVPAGDHNVKVYAAGDTSSPVIDADVTLGVGNRYTVAATNAVAAIEAQVLEDTPTPSCDEAEVRVIHFSADAPAVDIATAGADPADAVIQDLAYPNASDALGLPAGSYDLEVRLADSTTVALDLPGVAVDACTSYSVFAIGSAGDPAVGGNALQVVVAVDATAEAESGSAGGGGAEPTPPATDTVAEAGDPATDSVAIAAFLLAVAGVAFAAMVRRPVSTRVPDDQR
jgi:hypothetical protein